MMKNSTELNLLIIGAPAWGVMNPFYAVAVVAQIARNAGWNADTLDLNIDFYNHLDDSQRNYWNFDQLGCWTQGSFVSDIFHQHIIFFETTIQKALSKHKYSLIGLTVNDWTYEISWRVCDLIKKYAKTTPVIFGGISCYPGEKGTDILYKDVGRPDVILQGEAEVAFPQFLKQYAMTGTVQTEIPGFAYLRDGQIVENGYPSLPKLHEMSFRADFSGFPLKSYVSKGDFPSHFSRGCIYKCHFCSEVVNNRLYRFRRGEDVFNEINKNLPLFQAIKTTPHVYFADSLINGKLNELEKFCDLTIDSGLKFTWGGQAHFRKELSWEFLEKMSRAGCREFLWGFESGSQRIIDLMNKNYDIQVAERILKDCWELRMSSAMPVMIGYPGETPEDIVDTMLFIFRNYRYCNFLPPGIMVILPNSPISKNPDRYGIREALYYDWRTMDDRNNPNIRTLRRFFVTNAVRGSRFSEMGWLLGLDLSEPTLIRELLAFLEVIQRRLGQTASANHDLINVCEEVYAAADSNPCAITAVNTTAFKKKLARSVIEAFIELPSSANTITENRVFHRADKPALGFIDMISGTKCGDSSEDREVVGFETIVSGWAAVPGRFVVADEVVISIGNKRIPSRCGLGRHDVSRLVHKDLYAVGFTCAISNEDIPEKVAELTVDVHDKESALVYRVGQPGETIFLRRSQKASKG